MHVDVNRGTNHGGGSAVEKYVWRVDKLRILGCFGAKLNLEESSELYHSGFSPKLLWEQLSTFEKRVMGILENRIIGYRCKNMY